MTNPIGLFYGSSTSRTEYVAYELQDILNNLQENTVDVHNVGNVQPEKMEQYRYLIFGIPTWDIGDIQDDWDVFWSKLEKLDLSDKKIAIFGLGDQYGYADTFQDALGILAEEVLAQGAELVGYTDTSGYEFEDSVALSLDRKQFMGLAIDEDNQHDLTGERLEKWATQILAEFGLLERTLER